MVSFFGRTYFYPVKPRDVNKDIKIKMKIIFYRYSTYTENIG